MNGGRESGTNHRDPEIRIDVDAVEPAADAGNWLHSLPPARSLTFALVAGEASGDLLGEGLIVALKRRHPDARFVGIGGPRMVAAGLEAWYPAESLAVMGYAEVLRHLPRLLRIRRDLRRRLLALRPDVFVGIDAPDFNLGLERKLKNAGIRTVHYVSPSVWAWKEGRAAKIGRSADLLLCLFPMEPPIYAKHSVRAVFVGHPLADQFSMTTERGPARISLQLSPDMPVLALMPGSRLGEIQRLAGDFLDAARRCHAHFPSLQVIAPMASPACRHAFEQIAQAARVPLRAASDEIGAKHFYNVDNAEFHVRILDGQAHLALLASDVVLLASGTAALEAMLAKRPMVVAYKVSAWTYRIVTFFKLMRTTRYSLPNVLADRDLVEEILQDRCNGTNLANAVLKLLADAPRRMAMVAEFERQHLRLLANADEGAAAAIDALLSREAPVQEY
ncbi:MAG: lipid-A-disaccharide synthase [Tahibacter sp.]